MWRSVLFVKTAILLVQPGLGESKVFRYAKIVQEEAKARHFDPITVVAIVENESRWIESAIGGMNGACYGLGQTCAHAVPVCQQNGHQSAVCVNHMSKYLDGRYALRALSRSITRWRAYCRRKTGRPALFARWLSGYQGFNDHAPSGRKDVWCNMKRVRGRWRDVRTPALTRNVMRRRLEIIRATERKLR